MTIQDYKNELKQDILEYAQEQKGYCETLEAFNDACWIADSVTGNGSGSYTFNRAKAAENVKDIIFEPELLEMFKDFGYDRVPFEKGPEYIDVSIRCFLLDEVIAENEEEIKNLLGTL